MSDTAGKPSTAEIAELRATIAELKCQVRQLERADESLWQARFHNLIRRSPMGIHTYRLEAPSRLIFTGANPAADRILGVDSSQLVGQTIEEAFPPLAETEVPARYARACTDGEPWETAQIDYEHNEIRGAFQVHAFQTAPGEMAAFFQDITERKRAEQRELQLAAQLRQQQKLEAIGTLAAGVAHEIANPINGIMNYAQLLTNRLPADGQEQIYARRIVAESERIATIVSSLLAFARQEKQSHSPARLADIVRDTLDLMHAALRKDQITLSLAVPEDLPLICCRSQQIRQVLLNLLTNARDALNERYPAFDERKVLTLRAQVVEEGSQRWARLTVEDAGPGIPPAVMDRLFDPFFTTKPPDKGTGLGLSISYGLVKDNHGRLRIESRPGGPTCAHLELPPLADGPPRPRLPESE